MKLSPAATCLDRVDVGAFTIAEMVYAAGSVQTRHAHPDSGITLVLSGSLEETVARSREYARALSVVVKPLDTEHGDRIGNTGAHTLQIRIGSHAIEHEMRELGGWRWHHNGPIARDVLRVLQCFRARKMRETETAIYDLIGCARHAPIKPGEPPSWLKYVRNHIDDVLPYAVRVRDVARAAGVHPVYLARQFRRFMGCSVSEYLSARRLQRAADLIADPHTPLAAAAYRAGYADQSHLTRAFRGATGLTPRSYRQLATG